MSLVMLSLFGCGTSADEPAIPPQIPTSSAEVVAGEAPFEPILAPDTPEEAPVAVTSPPEPPAAPPSERTAPVSAEAPAASPKPLPEAQTPPPAQTPPEVTQGAPAAEPALPEPAPAAGPVTYSLVPKTNALYVVVTYQRGTLGASLAHDHVVVATRYSGTVTWDPSDPSSCAVAVDVPASGLRVDPAGSRAKAGLEGDAPPEDRPTIEENFNSKRQLDSASFPTLTFRAERCAARADGRFDVTGPLTIHGVSRPTTVAMKITADGESFRASGKLTASHEVFGMSPFSAAMGAVKNAEPLTFSIDLSGEAR